MKNKPIIENHNFLPTPILTESRNAVILQDHYVSTSGMGFCFQHGQTPVCLDKRIGRWASSRYVWEFLLKTAFNHSQDALTLIAGIHAIQADPKVKAMFEEKARKYNDGVLPEEAPIHQKFKMADILFNRAGFTKDEMSSPKRFVKIVENALSRRDSLQCGILVRKLMTLYSYAWAIRCHDVRDDEADKNLPESPTIKDLDRFVNKEGVGTPIWFGDMNFFGWDGDPENIGVLDPIESVDTDEAGIVAIPRIAPLACNLSGFSVSPKTGRKTIISLLSQYVDDGHDNFREANWHLGDEEFADNPVSPKGLRLESNFATTDEAWAGDDAQTHYFRAEGLPQEQRLIGGVILANDFYDTAEVIGTHTGVYEPQHPQMDQVWIKAITSLTARNISTYGVGCAQVLEVLADGYLLLPAFASSDIEDDFDEEAAYASAEDSPFNLFLIHGKDTIDFVKTDPQERSDFVELFQHTHMPFASKDEVEQLVDLAIAKFSANCNRAIKSNWLDEIGNLNWSSKKDINDFKDLKDVDLSSEQYIHGDGFSGALDSFVTPATKGRWGKTLAHVKEHGSIPGAPTLGV